MKLKKLDDDFMTRNEEAKAALKADPLFYHGVLQTAVANTGVDIVLLLAGKGRVGWAVQTINSMAELQDHATVRAAILRHVTPP